MYLIFFHLLNAKVEKLNKNKKIVKRKKNRMKLAKTWFDVEKRKCNS